MSFEHVYRVGTPKTCHNTLKVRSKREDMDSENTYMA